MIVTTYNWPKALEQVLKSLSEQTILPYEVIIADDGSTNDTAKVITALQQQYSLTIKHLWQEDSGFQAAKIRNKAAACASGDYLIFLDGDCIPLKHFIARSEWLAAKGYFVVGNRILLSSRFSSLILDQNLDLNEFKVRDWLFHRKNGDCNRLMPLLFLPFPRTWRSSRWQNAKTCNLALWKEDFLSVNGFDESYQGWGYEDSDLVIRLLKNGVKRKEGRYAIPVVHLWHQEQDRSMEKRNYQQLLERLSDNTIEASLGIDQYLKG